MTYQFKIQIEGFKNPKVWRQLEIPSDYSFLQFHRAIAIVFGHDAESLFSFSPAGKNSTPQIIPIDLPMRGSINAQKTLLSNIFKDEGQTYIYYPNASEIWTYHIVLENTVSKEISFPQCLDGEGVYPPMTCSDAEDYENMMQILSDKNHPQYKSTQEWLELNENETWEEKYKFDSSKINEQLKLINSWFRNYTFVKHDAFDEKYGLNPSLWELIDQLKDQLENNKKKKEMLWKIQKIVEEYPAIPHFKNMLATVYLNKGDKKRFFELSEQIDTEYPDYTMARCNLAIQYAIDNQMDKADELFGKKLDLTELYPNRNGCFTEMEIFHYHSSVFHYLLKKEDDTAMEHLEFLECFFPHAIEADWRMRVGMLRLSKIRENYNEKSVNVIPEQVAPTDGDLHFENPEIQLLYGKDFNKERVIIYRIMALPRASLIRDMEKILLDSIARYSYYAKNPDTEIDIPIHALFILSALQAEEALDTLLTVLRQDTDYYDFWYENMLTEDFWRFIYAMGQNAFEKLKNFVLEPNRYTYARIAVSSAMEQIAFHQAEKKDQVMKWYEEVIQYMLDNQYDETIFDTTVYSFYMNDFVDVAGREQFPIILRLYNENLMMEDHYLTVNQIKQYLVKKTPDLQERVVYTSIDPYYDKWYNCSENNFYENENTYEDYEDDKSVSLPKIGRNEPCPCGSGKKYKKCCLKG